MNLSSKLGLLLCVLVACGDDGAATPDSHTGNHPPPRIIPGGGIGDGAIDGVVNLYVIDDTSRMPLTNVVVRVGALDGMTDATGLFVADGLVGPQTVIAKQQGYRSEMWLGANGANMTMSLKPATDPAPASANLSGSITGFDALAVPTGHRKAAIVTYSNGDKAGDAANNIATAANANICDVPAATACTFTVTTRTGSVGLIAIIYDHDTKNTLPPGDDTYTPIAWAYKTGIDVASGINQTGVDLALVAPTDLVDVTVDFGTPPANLPTVAAVVGLEVGSSGTLQLVQFLTPTAPTVRAPKLSAIAGAAYRLTALANNGNTDTSAQSVVLHRGLSSTSLAAGTWLGVPSTISLTRTAATWTAIPGATVQGVEYGVDKTHPLLSITAFDASTSATIPDLIALPATGTLLGRVTGLQGTVDLQNFSGDDILSQITGFSSQPMQID